MQQDFIILRKALEEGHAGLYRYTKKKEMNATFDRVRRMIGRDMTASEFYAIVTILSDAIKCGHTQFVLPRELRTDLETTGKQLPLKVKFISGKAYVIASADGKVTSGAELLSINSKPIVKIAQAIMRHLPGDGDIKTGKFRSLSAKFSWYYYLFVEQTDSFAIAYLNPSRQRCTATLAALTEKDLANVLAKNNTAPAINDDKPWRYEVMSVPYVARLKVETFAPPDDGIDGQTFAQFLESSFKKIEDDKVDNLIIDFRGNDGGENYGPVLYSHIADSDFEVFASVDASTNQLPFISQYSKIGPDFRSKFAGQLLPENGGRYRASEKSEYFVSTQHPVKNSYRGKVWILIDGETFSSATVFCSLAKSHRRGLFVGEETGGAYRGFNAGELIVITLPASQLKVVIPLLCFTIATGPVSQPRRGILPDHPSQSSINDALNGTDSDLAFTLRRIGPPRSAENKSGMRN